MHVNTRVSQIKKGRRESVLFRAIAELLVTLISKHRVFSTRVALTPDSSMLYVYLGSDDGEDAVNAAIETLKLYKPSLRKSLSTMVSLRRTPDMHFVYDDQYDRTKRIETLLDEVKEKDKC